MSLFSRPQQDTTNTTDLPNPNPLGDQPIICSSLSGNELYCIALEGYSPGNILVGNSVYSLGVVGNFAANIHGAIGGEIPQYTNMISEGRRLALEHFEQEMQQSRAVGAAGVTNEVVFHPGNIEFLSVGSSLYKQDATTENGFMTSSIDGQELFCQLDAGYQPLRVAFGNVAYSIGIGGNILGELRQMGHGEVPQYSNVFNTTRNLALQRICEHAQQNRANCVTCIKTTVLPMGSKGIQEMILIGTASYHPQLADLAQQLGGVTTSGLTGQEMWSLMKLGYAPVRLVIGTSVYSLGILGGIKAALRGIAKGEISSLTEMVYGARENSLKKTQDQAKELGADMVVGIKTYIYQLEHGLVEFLAIGTAVKRMDGLNTRSGQLPPQAVVNDKDTFIDRTQQNVSVRNGDQEDKPDTPQSTAPDTQV